MLDTAKTIVEVIAASLVIAGLFWAAIRTLYRHYSKFLYFSGCHLISLTLRDDIVKQHPELESKLAEHAYEPLVVLPQRQKQYLRVKDGDRVLLRFKRTSGDELAVIAHAYSYPKDPQLWSSFDQPAISLVLRRYFGIERPLLGSEDSIPNGWRIIEHGTTRADKKELALLHRMSAKNGKLIWLVSEEYSARFWLPEKGKEGATYRSDWGNGWFLEYAGISLTVMKPSILSIRS